MSTFPLVSILIPVYNREKIVQQSIESALSQTYENFEIIIVDNCSTDNTWSVLQEYASTNEKIKIYRNELNFGPVINWQKCISYAQGDLIKIVFSDDTLSANFLQETVPVLDEHTAFVLSKIDIFGKYTINGFGDYYHRKEYSTQEFIYHAIFDYGKQFSVSPGCGLFRKSDLETSLMIDIPNHLGLDFKKMGAGNDLLIFLLTALRYKKIKIAPKAVAYFLAHDGSFTVANTLWLYYDYAKLYFLQKHYPNLIAKFKTLMWIRQASRKSAHPLLESTKPSLSVAIIIEYTLIKWIGKIKKHLPRLQIKRHFSAN
jgi:glycosyltransferase involved in cell wall biosynthesis